MTVPKDGYFLFPVPSLMVAGDAGPDAWQWTLNYDKARLIAAADLTAKPTDTDEIAMGDAGSGQVWQARGVAGTTDITYSYVNPEDPTTRVEGTYSVTVK